MTNSIKNDDYGDFDGGFSIPNSPQTAIEVCSGRVPNKKGHARDAIMEALAEMKPYTTPKINKADPNKWFIYFNHRVPEPLSGYFTSQKHRFKVYKDLNRQLDSEKQAYAERLCKIVSNLLASGEYDPFEPLRKKIEDKLRESAKPISMEVLRKEMPFKNVCELFIKSRQENGVAPKTITSYKNTLRWMQDVIPLDRPASEITRIEVSEALKKVTLEKQWSNTTYNNNVCLTMVFFRWMEMEEYIAKNPVNLTRKKEKKSVHRWYDKDTAQTVKEATKKQDLRLYYMMSFVYHICVRNNSELIKMKVGDIDFDMMRIRFRKEVSKNGNEQFRNISPEFHEVLNEMGLSELPKDWFIFGRGGVPDILGYHSGKYFSDSFSSIRKHLKIDSDFTIYSWKHTRVCHEIMKKTDPYSIMHLCRHSDLETTQQYIRDFDLNLSSVYKDVDLRF